MTIVEYQRLLDWLYFEIGYARQPLAVRESIRHLIDTFSTKVFDTAVGEFYAVIDNNGKICEVITENERKTKEELLWFYNHRSNEKLGNFRLVPCKVVLNKEVNEE